MREVAMKQLGMMEPAAALAIVVEQPVTVVEEEVPLEQALGRVLCRPLAARLSFPLFDKAAVDGIGIAGGDDSPEFLEIGSITAGEAGTISLKKGECVKIMTGAPVPAGIGRIVRFEFTTVHDRRYRIVKTEKDTNIAYQAEDIRAGDPLLDARRLLPQDIGVLASQGYARVPVARRPRLSVLVTGNELHTPGSALAAGGIYDSNSYQLTAMATLAGAEPVSAVRVGDDPEVTLREIGAAFERSDLVVLSGGVSMGDLDYVPEALKALGVDILFHGVAIKPGKPTIFGRLGDKFVIGLPGNPVSTFVQFELLIVPLIQRLLGLVHRPKEAELPLAEPFSRTKADRHEYLPARLENGTARLLPYMGSGHITSLAGADLLVRIDKGTLTLTAEDRVYARFIR
jgi:molybdopterin molybdotransferase